MPNHFHLLVRTGKEPLARGMRHLMTGYALNFNLRHKRRGHLFQNRYKSIVCQEDLYLLELTRYIHDIQNSGSRKRKVSGARRGFCRASVEELGYPSAAVARFLGLTTSSVARAARAE